MLPKIAAKQESAFSINTNALLNGSISLTNLAKCVISLKSFSQAQTNSMVNFWDPEQSAVGLQKYTLGFSNLVDKLTADFNLKQTMNSNLLENSNLVDNKGHQLDIGVPEENSNNLVHPNPNSKQSLDCDNFARYIEEYRFKSVETKRKRVRYTCKYENWGKQYHKRWNLVDHIKTHLGVTPYKCEFCESTFVQKGNLKKHLRQHQFPDLKKRKAFQWMHCHKSYTERYNLMHHIKSKHEDECTNSTHEIGRSSLSMSSW